MAASLALATTMSCASATPTPSPAPPPATMAPAAPTATTMTMTMAMAQARARIPQFWSRLRLSTEATEIFGVLLGAQGAGCGDHGGRERWRWLESVQRRGDQVFGIVDSADEDGGAVVSGSVDDICDWIIISGDVIEGGYTLRLQRAALSPAEQAAFDASVGGTFAPDPD